MSNRPPDVASQPAPSTVIDGTTGCPTSLTACVYTVDDAAAVLSHDIAGVIGRSRGMGVVESVRRRRLASVVVGGTVLPQEVKIDHSVYCVRASGQHEHVRRRHNGRKKPTVWSVRGCSRTPLVSFLSCWLQAKCRFVYQLLITRLGISGVRRPRRCRRSSSGK